MTCPECGDFGTIEHEGGQSICPFCATGAALRGPPLDESRIHPALMSSQERLALSETLRRIADNPADCFDPDKLRQAAKVIEYQEAKLALVRSAVA